MVDLASITIPYDTLSLISKDVALELSALPLSSENGAVVVALPQDYEAELLDDLRFLLGKKIIVEPVPKDVVRAKIRELYQISVPKSNNPGLQPSIEMRPPKSDSSNQPKNGLPGFELSADGSIVAFVNKIISDAIQLHASDIHVEPYERELRVRYRLDGVLHEVIKPQFEKGKALISRLKIIADLDIAEKRRPQDGRIRIKERDRTIDIRVSTLPTDFGEKVVLRILDKSHLQLDLEKLGFEEDGLRLFRRMIRLPFGMILVTGPTGSGKTTTLYAALNSINEPQVNITTIEDPIEYNLVGINQTHVRSDIGLTFAAALRSILRQDPNIIMVGEIRDCETAEIAIRAALTGHLVFSTLHTNDAASAVTRLIDMGVEPFLVSASVKMILAQRLLRSLCEKCKVPFNLKRQDLDELQIEGIKEGGLYYKARGCQECNHTGYRGRSAVFEVLPLENGLSELIAHSAGATELRAHAKQFGFQTLRGAAMRKAGLGITSLDEVARETAV